jgi:undecaprenyl-diphosphatase
MRLVESAFAIDVRMFRWCQQRRYRYLLVILARQLSHSADGYLYFLIGGLALYFGYFTFFALALIAFVIERIFYFIIKNHFRRNRPPDIIPGFRSVVTASDKFSFPSGHTSAAFLMSTAIVLYFPALAWVLYPWAISVGWSRVMLGVHFPGDTIAGALLGSSVVLFLHINFASALVF